MADINVTPLPIASDLGIGYWVDLKEKMLGAISTLEDNTASEDDLSSGASSSAVDEVVNAFDPEVHTVAEFMAAVDVIIDALNGILPEESSA